ncbi:Uncharacterised protein [Mycobacteroides abscessus subsp. abscessus]|nr:Uncharacterised protein [Mycobacteroides abscessus subsp. abscessus]
MVAGCPTSTAASPRVNCTCWLIDVATSGPGGPCSPASLRGARPGPTIWTCHPAVASRIACQ